MYTTERYKHRTGRLVGETVNHSVQQCLCAASYNMSEGRTLVFPLYEIYMYIPYALLVFVKKMWLRCFEIVSNLIGSDRCPPVGTSQRSNESNDRYNEMLREITSMFDSRCGKRMTQNGIFF